MKATESQVNFIFDKLFGYNGYNKSEKEFIVTEYLNSENISPEEAIKELKCFSFS